MVLPLHLEFVTNAPDGGQRPVVIVLDFFPETFDVDVYGPGIADILISPDMVQQLLTGEDLIRGGSKEI